MNRVTLGDVATERRETCRGDKARYPVVGLEHLTPEEIALTAWDDGSENTFTKLFQKGDILFGRRRAYLKKAAITPFDGICSGDITVIEAKPDNILPELLPFVIQNDAFFDFAVGKSAGSLSPRAKWEHLKDYEFNLPAMDEQRKLACALWAINGTIEAYKKLLAATDELVKSQFIEMFGDPETNPKLWKKAQYEDICSIITDGEHATPRRCEKGIYLLSARNVLTHRLSFDNVDYIDDEEYKRISQRIIPQAGDILISCSGTVGRACVVPSGLKFQMVRSVALLRFDDCMIPDFMEQLISMPYTQKQIDASKSQTSQANLFQGKIQKLEAIVPPKTMQEQFCDFSRQTDKSKFELEQALKAAKATYKSIIAENLG